MTQPSLDSFFTTGGGRSVSWRDKPIGSTVSGIIEQVHPPQQVTDPLTNEKKFNRNGEPQMQVRIDLATDWRNFEMCKTPDDPNEVDDGRRSLYVGGWMRGAIADAIHKAGRKGTPEVGARLSVTLTERTPNRDNPILNPTNKFEATYQPPAQAATAEFFGTSGATSGAGAMTATATPAASVSNIGPTRPPSISAQAWAAMDEATRAVVAGAVDAPPF